MTQRRRTSKAKAKRGFGRRAFLTGAGVAACAAAGWYLQQKSDADHTAASGQDTPPAPNPALPAGEWRAVWVSYLDWALLDFSTEDTFRAGAAQLLDNCAGLGLNTVLAQVRPFGDALYRSSLFPWSHLCTGVQGKDPGFDPLDVFLTEAHRRGIGVEAWVNPYRLRSSAAMPPNLAENNLANTHPDWLCTAGEGLYLNPAVPAAADYVVQGVAELVQNYAVDGIHFDDYFYPTTDPSIDAAQFAASGEADLTAWRRANVTRLVKAAHDAVKAADPTLRFGVSPQGNPDNDRNEQYTDLSVWLTASGADAVVDYLCPQIYWGYGYTLSSGSTRFAFENITAVAFPPPGLRHGPLFRAGSLPGRCGRRWSQRRQRQPVVHRQRAGPAGDRPAQRRGRGLGALPLWLPVPLRRKRPCRRRACRSDGIGRLRHRKSLVSRKKMRYTMVSCKNIAFFTCCF